MKMVHVQKDFFKHLLVLCISSTIVIQSVNCVFSSNSDSVKLVKDDHTIEQLDLEKMFKRIDTIEHSPLFARSSDGARGGNLMKDSNFSSLEKEVWVYVQNVLDIAKYDLTSGLSIARLMNDTATNHGGEMITNFLNEQGRGFDDAVLSHVTEYVQKHVLNVDIPETGRLFFKAFGLKKLMFPLFIGAQILKSVLLAMFLPSILGSIGKIVGKGVSSLSGLSQNSGNDGQIVDDLEFKDPHTSPYSQDGQAVSLNQLQQGYVAAPSEYAYPQSLAGIQMQTLYPSQSYSNVNTNNPQQPISRFGPGGQPMAAEDFYMKPQKQNDFKVFHDIPASSQLLASYDPFYSPLLSRLDAVFQQLGLDNTEACRERTVCLMYANPAKYAPYSNLVSAQLSRELNELKKPTTDNTEILRFFKYMKAAKDGQDGEDCVRAHPDCSMLPEDGSSPAMITTFNDINKLVQARKLRST